MIALSGILEKLKSWIINRGCVLEFLSRPLVAITYFLIAMMLIPLNDALVKLMSGQISVFEVMGVRAFFALLILLVFPLTLPAMRKLSLKLWLQLSLRGIFLTFSMLFFFLPLATLGLAEVNAIFFTAPLWISVLSVPLLGEKLGIFRIIAVITGLCGVLLVVKPGGDGFQIAYIMPMISAFSYAAFQIITRYLREDADVMAMVGVQNIVYFVVGMGGMLLVFLFDPSPPEGEIWGFLLRGWKTPGTTELLYLAIASLIVLNLSFASTNVYSNVEATYVAPFEYIALPMAIMWGIAIWGDWPEPGAWIGMGLILGGGILMIYRENRKDTDIASSVPMRAAAVNSVSLDGESPHQEKEFETRRSVFDRFGVILVQICSKSFKNKPTGKQI